MFARCCSGVDVCRPIAWALILGLMHVCIGRASRGPNVARIYRVPRLPSDILIMD